MVSGVKLAHLNGSAPGFQRLTPPLLANVPATKYQIPDCLDSDKPLTSDLRPVYKTLVLGGHKLWHCAVYMCVHYTTRARARARARARCVCHLLQASWMTRAAFVLCL